MKEPKPLSGFLLGALTAIPLMALLYLGEKVLGTSFFPFDLFDWIARALPGQVVTAGIDGLVSAIRILGLGEVSDTAKLLEQLIALSIFIVLGGLFGLLVTFLNAAFPQRNMLNGVSAGLAFFVLVLFVGSRLGTPQGLGLRIPWLLLLATAWGLTLGWGLKAMSVSLENEEDFVRKDRRSLLIRLGAGSVGLAIGAWGLARLASKSASETATAAGASQPLPTATPVPGESPTPFPEPALASDGRIEPAPGTRPELTSNEEFYRIDINTRPPVISDETWQLEVAGLFARPRNLTLEDLMSYSPVTQPITLSCISNQIGGDLIGTSNWTGVRLRDVLNDLQLLPEAGALFVEAEDGFFETVVMNDMMDERTLLVYGMNGETLPIEHGFPLRIYVPNRYGMKQPKWIVRIEAIEAWTPGYWVQRGWSREARPRIVSVIDTFSVDSIDDGRFPLGGIAWAGDRGIQSVEVRVDDGPWEEAELRKPPLSTLTWVQWRFDWPAVSGLHTFTVRATDGTGSLQIDEETGVRPDGATGYHSRTLRFDDL